jgi:arginine decarboxylase-like protein
MSKKTIAMIVVAATVSVAGIGAAEASSNKSVTKVTSVSTTARPSIGGMAARGEMDEMGAQAQLAAVLASLVTKNTITQAQSDAITAALTAARTAAQANHPAKVGPLGVNQQALILSTLGITATELQTGLQAGKSLATIAGAKTAALITALVNAETAAIDAAVTAGKMTAAQAVTAKAGLTAHVTAEVNQVGPIGGMGMGMGRGPGHK